MKRFPMALAALALIAAACGDSATTTPPPSASTTEIPQPQPAALAPPASFAEVETDYLARTVGAIALGKAAADQFLGGDFEPLYARFDAGMTAELTIEDLAAGRSELESQAPFGELGLQRGLSLGQNKRFYAVDLEWGEEKLTLNASFNDGDQITGLFLTPQLPLPPDPTADYESDVAFRLPFEGLWFTFWGGDTVIQNYHVEAAVQRHAFDFVVWKEGGTHVGNGIFVEDYWAYGQKVLAPADGTVVEVVDGLRDQVPQTEGDTANPAGNHVIIEVAEGEYLLIAHMQAGSITVAEGDEVESGQQIGLVGNSGSTTEPHIHIHLQDEPVFSVGATGYNLEFTDYVANATPVPRDQPLADQFVVNG